MTKALNHLEDRLKQLKLSHVRENYNNQAKVAVSKGLGHIDYLSMLVEGECEQRSLRSIERRVRQARFPVIKSLDQFDFTYPEKIDTHKVKHLFQLDFIRKAANVLLIGGCGLGKSHLATSLGYHACHHGYRVLFTPAVDMINALAAAAASHTLPQELRKYCKPDVLIIDELGYLPIDKYGADLLFQVISSRYERGSIIITSNRIFKDWPVIFNNDATLTSAVLDRILHHHELILIEGPSYRMRKPV